MESRIVKRNEPHSALMLIVCMLPVLLFLLLALVGIQISPLLVPIILILCCLAMFWLMAGCHPHRHATHTAEVAAPVPESSEGRGIDLPSTVTARTERRVGDAVIVEAELREPAEEHHPPYAGARGVGWVAYLLLFAILTPLPHRLYEALGIHCPYL